MVEVTLGPTAGPPLWTQALRRRREPLNERLAAAIAAGASPDALATALRDIGEVVAARLDGMPRGRVDDWVEAVVATVCDRTRRGSWGPHTLAHWVLTEVALRLAGPVAEPGPAVADLVRAAERLWDRADLTRWGGLVVAGAGAMAADAGMVGRARLRELGAVAGWRSGDVRLRDAAHRVAATLPPAVAAATLGLPAGADVAAVLAANLAVPQAWPGATWRFVGGPRVLGGCFATPPRVRAGDGLLWLVEDGSGTPAVRELLLVADAHGWLVEPTSATAPPASLPSLTQLPALAPVTPAPTMTTGAGATGSGPRRWAAYQAGGCRLGASPTSFRLLVGPAA